MGKIIEFNKPHFSQKSSQYIDQAVTEYKKISGNGIFTNKCHNYFEEKYGFKKCLLTTSCTDALEMSAILSNLEPGDQVIIPSYTFVSTANAFVLRGAEIVFADSYSDHPNIDPSNLEDLIGPKTKVIVVVHYGGVGCDMDKIMKIANKHNLTVIEDSAHAIDSYYKGKPLGSIGHMATFSFHETKNISSGEGGMLVVNDHRLLERAEIIWEKGTNRTAFNRGEVSKYSWIDIGSSFLPSELIAAVLYAQLEELEIIQSRRLNLWNNYFEGLNQLAEQTRLSLLIPPSYATKNGHLFSIVTRNARERDELILHLKNNGIMAVFHYLALHRSPYYTRTSGKTKLPQAEKYSDCLLRLPFFFDLNLDLQKNVIQCIREFYMN